MMRMIVGAILGFTRADWLTREEKMSDRMWGAIGKCKYIPRIGGLPITDKQTARRNTMPRSNFINAKQSNSQSSDQVV